MSAELPGVNAARLYHVDLLAKQPGCGGTPWHYDHQHFPLATNNIIAAWIPAHTIAPAIGPLTFADPLKARHGFPRMTEIHARCRARETADGEYNPICRLRNK